MLMAVASIRRRSLKAGQGQTLAERYLIRLTVTNSAQE